MYSLDTGVEGLLLRLFRVVWAQPIWLSILSLRRPYVLCGLGACHMLFYPISCIALFP